MLSIVLARKGYRVLTAGSGSEAIRTYWANRAAIQLIVSEVHLPGLTGPQFMDVLRWHGSDVPVLYMSGVCTIESLRSMLKPGEPVLFFPKPLGVRSLLATIAERLETSASRKPPAREAGKSQEGSPRTGRSIA